MINQVESGGTIRRDRLPTALDSRSQSLKSCLGKPDCGAVLFAPAFDPPVLFKSGQRRFTCRDWEVSSDTPIIPLKILHERSLIYVRDHRSIFAVHFLFTFLPVVASPPFDRRGMLASIMIRNA